MPDRPIIFSGESVRAILDGKKGKRRKLYAPRGTDPADPEHLAARLMNGIDHINERGCWIWGRSLSEGYGSMTILGRTVRAHRLALSLATGRNERSFEEVRHQCDNPLCCNPEHLVDGTHRENVVDAVRKGRLTPPDPARLYGDHNPAAKLDTEKVAQIRRELATGAPQRVIAARHGISQSTVSLIKLGKRWSKKGL